MDVCGFVEVALGGSRAYCAVDGARSLGIAVLTYRAREAADSTKGAQPKRWQGRPIT